MAPYIFFDIDGVLNSESDWRKQHFYINPACLDIFAKFVDFLNKKYKTVPQLITCSTWRAGFDKTKVNDANATSILEKEFHKARLKINGATPISNKTRQEEIEYYMRRNDVQKYIVIDDDPSLYINTNRINLYVPDYRTGLVKSDLKKLEKQFVKIK